MNSMSFSMQKRIRFEYSFVLVAIFFTALFVVLPYILFGKNCIITIHDNLDSNLPWYKYIRDNGYYFLLNTKSSTLDNISSMYFAGDFSYRGFLYYLFDEFTAYVIVYFSSLVIGFFAMKSLLIMLFGNNCKNVIYLVSVIYTVLPIFPGYRIAIATLPFIATLFYKVYDCFKLKYLLLCLLIPMFSVFECTLIFVLGSWFLLAIVLSIKEKKVHSKLFICFIFMCFSAVIINLRLFLMRFLYIEPLNRTSSKIEFTGKSALIGFFKEFIKYFAKGHYHANSIHLYIILPLTIFALIYGLFVLKKSNYKFGFLQLNKYCRILLICLLIIVFNCIIISLNNLNILLYIFESIIPPLAGLSFARLYVFNNILWYIVFSCIVLYLYTFKWRYGRIISYFLVFLQLALVLFSNNYYQDSFKSWKANIFGDVQDISYKDFYAESLMEGIKKDIGYNGEICIGVGYHPSILMYNGFNTADGYISTYPMADALRFKDLIQPELDVNDWANSYYTSWWGRRYIYCKDISYEPTKKKYNGTINLRIDTKVFKDYYNGKYVFSRAEITNYIDLGLEFVNKYSEPNAIYEFWVYKNS